MPDDRVPDDFVPELLALDDFAAEERVPDDFAADERVPDDFAADERVPDDFAADERVPDDFAVDDARERDAVVPEAARERDAVVPDPARERAVAPGDLAAVERDVELVPRLPSSAVTRRARFSISPRRPRRSSSTPRSSSSWRTRVTARATSSTISRPRSFEPAGSARSTALRIASTVSAASEPFLFFFLSFFGMARV